MAINLLTTGPLASGPADIGVEFTISAGTPGGINLKGFDNTARVVLQKQDDTAAWVDTSVALTASSPDGVLVNPGVYRAKRVAGICGVFRD